MYTSTVTRMNCMNIALNTTQRILTIVIILALSIAGITPTHAAETQNTLHQKRTQFGFTMSIPDPDNPEQAYRDLDKMKELGVKWVRTGIITSDMVTRWGDGGKVEVNQETIDLYVDFLKKAKSYNMKVILMSVEGYYGDITYNQYLTEMRQYWNLISEPLSPTQMYGRFTMNLMVSTTGHMNQSTNFQMKLLTIKNWLTQSLSFALLSNKIIVRRG